jgi:hypothetical protein
MHSVRLKYQYMVSHRTTAGSCLAPGTKMAVSKMTPPRENRCSQMSWCANTRNAKFQRNEVTTGSCAGRSITCCLPAHIQQSGDLQHPGLSTRMHICPHLKATASATRMTHYSGIRLTNKSQAGALGLWRPTAPEHWVIYSSVIQCCPCRFH